MENPNRKTNHARKTNVCLGAKARLVILVTNILDLHVLRKEHELVTFRIFS